MIIKISIYLFRVISTGCWEVISHKCKDRYGYSRVVINKKKTPLHRWMWEFFWKLTIPRNHVVMHQCDNPSCCNPSHLHIGTYQENMTDKMNKNRCVPRKVYSKSLKTKILALIKDGKMTYAQIANKYGMSVRTLSNWTRENKNAGN